MYFTVTVEGLQLFITLACWVVLVPGGYYLTSVYASLCLIQSLDREQPFSGCLTPEAQEALKEWSCRRSREAQRQKENQQSQVGTRCFDRSGSSSSSTTQKDCSSVTACVGLCSDLLYSCHTQQPRVKSWLMCRQWELLLVMQRNNLWDTLHSNMWMTSWQKMMCENIKCTFFFFGGIERENNHQLCDAGG